MISMQGLIFFPKVHWNLLVLNIGMEEIKFVEHKINLPLPGSNN